MGKLKILVRGAGDIASGIIWSLAYAGFDVCCTEVENPSTIRTEVAFSSAIYEGRKVLDGIECILCGGKGSHSLPVQDTAHISDEGSANFPPYNIGKTYSIVDEINKCWEEKKVALVIDPDAKILDDIKFDVVVDAILAKKNLGTKIDMAKLVIGVGPGFTTGVDCHYAIETMRGHNLARIIENGSPMENTGVPGLIAGHSDDRVIHSPARGIIHNLCVIGDTVKKDEVIAVIDEGSQCVAPTSEGSQSSPVRDGVKVHASIDGILRGIIRDRYFVEKGLKIADIDPRLSEKVNCFTISDKARSIGGAVVTSIMHYFGN